MSCSVPCSAIVVALVMGAMASAVPIKSELFVKDEACYSVSQDCQRSSSVIDQSERYIEQRSMLNASAEKVSDSETISDATACLKDERSPSSNAVPSSSESLPPQQNEEPIQDAQSVPEYNPLYVWNSVESFLTNEAPNYDAIGFWFYHHYIAHSWTSYGQAILALEEGDVLSIDGHMLRVDSFYYGPKGQKAHEVYDIVGRDAWMLQTCYGADAFMVCICTEL